MQIVTAVEDEAKPEATWPRTCGCGESWSQPQWAELPSHGVYDAGGEGWFELRTCVCGALLTVPCEPPAKTSTAR